MWRLYIPFAYLGLFKLALLFLEKRKRQRMMKMRRKYEVAATTVAAKWRVMTVQFYKELARIMNSNNYTCYNQATY
jgi:hypothetical protein